MVLSLAFCQYPGMKPVFTLLFSACLAGSVGLASSACLASPGSIANPVAAARAATVLTPHHAVYSLSLDRAPGGSVIAAEGRMDYQLSDACEAWATAQRLDMNITNDDGSVSHMISDYVTWEQKDGRLLRFSLHQTSNQKVLADIEGEATRNADGSGHIRYTAPENKQVDLPAGTLFPMAQTIALLNDAASGRKFLAAPLFDGTDEDGAEDSFTVIGGFDPALAPPRWPLLRQIPNGRVDISFFERGKGDDTPSYEVAMRYWQNGVSDDVAMDFGDFVVKASLTNLSSNGKRC